jgi:peptidoglycan/LPS O-acetylase OafA/YrhL
MTDIKIYRPDIDGLRAIAVLSVLFFHYGVKTFSGGYVGVDVFFVISGYLISKIIIENIESNTFSFLDFYARRARRILPAFFIVSLISLICSFIFFHSAENERIFESFNAALLFFSNIYFYIKLDYFSPNTNELPFLHYWSLSLEEQFYFVFPGIVFLSYKLKPKINLRYVIICIFTLSIILAQYTVVRNQSEAFYLPMARAWELLVGTTIFLISQKINVKQRKK